MKVKIDIPQIFAKAVTHPKTSPDQIYIAYFVSLAKLDKEHLKPKVIKYSSKKISDVRRGIKKGKVWVPKNTESIIDTKEAEALFLTIALYERDDGVIYKKLVNKSKEIEQPDSFDWSYIELPVDFKNWYGWVKPVWKLIVGTFNYLKQDDLLGEYSIVIPTTDIKEVTDSWGGLREIRFKKFGGDYRVMLSLCAEV